MSSVIRLNGANAKTCDSARPGGTEALEGQQRERGARVAPGDRIDRPIVLAGPRQSAIPAFHIAEQHQFARIFHRQLAEEHVVDKAEDRRIRADAEPEREHDDCGEARGLQEAADSESDIGNGHSCVRRCSTPEAFMGRLPQASDIPEFRNWLIREADGLRLSQRLSGNHDSGRLSFRISPAQRGVVRSSAPYQNRSNMELIGSRWSMAFSNQSASASNSWRTQW